VIDTNQKEGGLQHLKLLAVYEKLATEDGTDTVGILAILGRAQSGNDRG
jgi:hypothetical protein